MIGRATAWARRLFRPLPPQVSTITELTEIWITPSRPSWDYVSLDGPWRIVRHSLDNDLLYFLEEYDSLGEAIEAFYLYNRPQPEQGALMVDGHDQVVLGWRDWFDADTDYRFAWYGCAFGFHALAHFDPVDAALFEQLAQQEER